MKIFFFYQNTETITFPAFTHTNFFFSCLKYPLSNSSNSIFLLTILFIILSVFFFLIIKFFTRDFFWIHKRKISIIYQIDNFIFIQKTIFFGFSLSRKKHVFFCLSLPFTPIKGYLFNLKGLMKWNKWNSKINEKDKILKTKWRQQTTRQRNNKQCANFSFLFFIIYLNIFSNVFNK